jgi:hypothetical protein
MAGEMVYVVMINGEQTTKVIPEENKKKPEGPTALDRVGDLVKDHATTVVTEQAAHAAASAAMPLANVLLVANPALGMVAQLALASRSIDPDKSMAVMTPDNAGVRKGTLDRCEQAFESSGSDVAYPTAGGQAGYPVYLSPEARTKLDDMPDGDLLEAVKGDNSLTKTAVECRDVGIYMDLGSPEDRREKQRERSLGDDMSLERQPPSA